MSTAQPWKESTPQSFYPSVRESIGFGSLGSLRAGREDLSPLGRVELEDSVLNLLSFGPSHCPECVGRVALLRGYCPPECPSPAVDKGGDVLLGLGGQVVVG